MEAFPDSEVVLTENFPWNPQARGKLLSVGPQTPTRAPEPNHLCCLVLAPELSRDGKAVGF